MKALLEAMGLWPRRDRRCLVGQMQARTRVDLPVERGNPPPNPGVPSKLNAPRPSRATLTDRELLIRCDSLLSIIRYRELAGLTSVTLQELDGLLPKLRARTDELTTRKGANPR